MASQSCRFSAHVLFMDEPLVLIHIPISFYPFFIHPILQLLFHDVSPIDSGGKFTGSIETDFLNISITPVECSITCSRTLATLYFVPMVDKFRQIAAPMGKSIDISEEEFLAMQVEGQGLDAGQRVVELTSPLAMAGISIFFISTYFTDYVLVPKSSKTEVIETLLERGFNVDQFTGTISEESSSQFNSSISSPESLAELQARTLMTLHDHDIQPQVDMTLRLVQCAAHYREFTGTKTYAILRPNLVASLLQDNPRFFSLTVAATDPAPSLLLEKRLLSRFLLYQPEEQNSPSSSEEDANLLLGSKEDTFIAITLDLQDLSFEAAGIVAGVASTLAADPASKENVGTKETNNHNLELGFLSTARAVTVIVCEEAVQEDKIMLSGLEMLRTKKGRRGYALPEE
ncbi:hypothetical protein FQN57_004845 [Myotisia sp. PD_48]|nr:hypothetical protein FQN57_004845 [Myotisia sp. PD_48]